MENIPQFYELSPNTFKQRQIPKPLYKISIFAKGGKFYIKMPDGYIEFNSLSDLIENIRSRLVTLKEFRFQILFPEPEKTGYKKPKQEDIEEIQEAIN